MKDLIEALTIFSKYGNPSSPTHCEHDILIVQIHPELVSAEDLRRLDELSFVPDEDLGDCFSSYRFGSC